MVKRLPELDRLSMSLEQMNGRVAEDLVLGPRDDHFGSRSSRHRAGNQAHPYAKV